MKEKKFFYGWVVVLGCFLMQAIPMVFMSQAWSFYQIPISQAMNVNYAQFSVSSMIATIATMAFSVLMASRVAVGNTRRYVLIGGIVAGLCFSCYRFATAMWQIYFLQAICNFAMSATLFIPANILISNWFVDRKGMATSICYSGSAVGGVIFTKMISGMIANNGWQHAIFVSGLLSAATAVVAFLMIRKLPSDMGLEPYQLKKEDSADDVSAQAQMAPQWMGLTKAEAMKTASFWLMAIFAVCGGLLASGIISQVPTYLTELEIDYSNVMVTFSFVSIFAALAIGPVYDKIGIGKGIAICSSMTAICCICLILCREASGLAFLAVALWAFGSTAGSLAPPLLVGRVFGVKDMGGIFGLMNTFFYGGCMLGGIVCSGIRTATGSYRSAWIVFIVIAALQVTMALLALAASKKIKRDCTQEEEHG